MMTRLIDLFSFSLLLFCLAMPSIVLTDEYDNDDEDSDLPFVVIETAADFAELSSLANASDKIIMLELSASYCGYCELLEEEIIKPMLRSGDYDETVLIRKLMIDSYYNIRDFEGNITSPDQLASTLGVRITPTLIFLDDQGNEVAPRILGVNSLDFFGGYVDEAIEQGLRRIR